MEKSHLKIIPRLHTTNIQQCNIVSHSRKVLLLCVQGLARSYISFDVLYYSSIYVSQRNFSRLVRFVRFFIDQKGRNLLSRIDFVVCMYNNILSRLLSVMKNLNALMDVHVHYKVLCTIIRGPIGIYGIWDRQSLLQQSVKVIKYLVYSRVQ